jgi:hypothetical protein
MQFKLDGKIYVVSHDDLCNRTGCHLLDGTDSCKCEECGYKCSCPADEVDFL